MQRATPATERLQRDAFVPPPERGLGPAATLAILVHLALLLCLSWVVKWRDQPVIIAAQAELWAKLPLQTEPEPVPVPPPPPAEPAPKPAPPPPPPEPATATAEPANPAPTADPTPPPKLINEKSTAADIAEQKKKATKLTDQGEKLAQEAEIARKQKERDEAEAAARKQKERDEAEAAARKQKERDEAEAAARKQKEKDEAEAAARKQKEREEAEAARKQKEKDDAEAARKQREKEEAEAAVRKQKEKEEAARKERERQRKEQEDRIKKMARELEIKDQTEDLKKRILKNADLEISTVDSTSKLVAKISDKYAASIQAAIRPNITFDANSVNGNPAVEIQVGLAADGAIVSITTVKSSGMKSWDTAATRALEKTERLPKDETGRVPPTLLITLRPRER